MNDIIVSFLAWWNGVIALLKFFIQIIAFCFPISLFLLLCSIIFWFIKKFFQENIEDEGENNLTLDNNEDEN